MAVLDTGLLECHEDLKKNVKCGQYFGDGNEGSAHNDDWGGHGTHVAGIVAAELGNGKGGAGIAPDAIIKGFAVFPEVEDKEKDIHKTIPANDADIIRAIHAAIEQSYDIINMSLGGGPYSQVFQNAVTYAYNSGIAVFCATGNESTNGNGYPAAYDHAIAIAAIDQTGGKAEFSNYGSYVDFCFPGVDIWSTKSEYGSDGTEYIDMQGTSMACPAAAGTAAVILSAREDIKNMEGGARVDALISVMKKGVTKPLDSGIGVGTTYLPNALGLSTSLTAPAAPTIEIQDADDTISADGKYYIAESVTARVSLRSRDNVEIYYSTDGKTPTYKNGVATNGTLFDDQSKTIGLYYDDVTLTGAQKVTIKAIAVNTKTGLASKVASKTVTLRPIPTAVAITQDNNVNSITAGTKLALKAAVTPSYAISTKVQWSVDETATAAGVKVSTSGVVTTTAATPTGDYTVFATAVGSDGKTYDDGKYDAYTVHVVGKVTVKSFKLTTTKATIDMTEQIDLSQSVQIVTDPEDAEAPGVVWTSNKTSVATVDENGLVNSEGKGTATITGTLNDGSGKKVTCKITVVSNVTAIEISGPTTVASGKSIQLKAAVTPSDATNTKVKWSVSPSSAATINASGRLTAKRVTEDKAIVITAEAADGSGVKQYKYMTVKAGAITGITLQDAQGNKVKSFTLYKMTSANVQSGTSSADLQAIVTGGDGADTDAVEFSSSAPGIVAIEQSGNIVTMTAKAVGKATITCAATDGSGRKATCTVNVNIPMSRIAVRPQDGNLGFVAPGKSLQLNYKYGTRFGKPTNTKVVWASEDTNLATVTQSGKVTVSKTAKGDFPNYNTVRISATAADGSGVVGYFTVMITPLMDKIDLKKESGRLIVYGAVGDKEYKVSYCDVKVSGGTRTYCNFAEITDDDDPDKGYHLVAPGTSKVTYRGDLSDVDTIARKYTEKVNVTVTIKDGSNMKKTLTVYIANDSKGQTKYFYDGEVK